MAEFQRTISTTKETKETATRTGKSCASVAQLKSSQIAFFALISMEKQTCVTFLATLVDSTDPKSWGADFFQSLVVGGVVDFSHPTDICIAMGTLTLGVDTSGS